MLHCEQLNLMETFLATKPENYSQTLLKNLYVADVYT